MALEVMKLIFAVLDMSFNSGHYTVIIKRQFLHINISSFSTLFIYIIAVVHDFVRTVTRTGRSKFNSKAKMLLVWCHNLLIKVKTMCLSNIEVIGQSMVEI